MTELSTVAEVNLGKQGRLVIPASLRRSLGFAEGDKLIVREEGGRLVIEKQETVKRRLKSRFAAISGARHLADELIAERKEAAAKEAQA